MAVSFEVKILKSASTIGPCAESGCDFLVVP